MAGGPSFNKRQRELKRQQRKSEKAQRKLERRVEKANRPPGSSEEDTDLVGIVPGPQPLEDDSEGSEGVSRGMAGSS